MRYLTVEEVAKILNYSRRGVRGLLNQGILRGTNPTGRKWIILEEDLARFADESGQIERSCPAAQDEIDLAIATLKGSQTQGQKHCDRLTMVAEGLKISLEFPTRFRLGMEESVTGRYR